MTAESHSTYAVYPVGKIAFIAGLQWRWLPVRGRAKMRAEAREQLASRWVSLPVGDAGEPGSLLGTLVDRGETPVRHRQLASLALAVQPSLAPNAYGVFPLAEGRWWFVAVVNGLLSPYGDVVGSEQAVRAAVATFLMALPVPADGWTLYAPSGFFDGAVSRLEGLSSLLQGREAIERARLHKTESKTALSLWLLSGLLIGGAWWGYHVLQSHQDEVRRAHAQALIRAQQAALVQHPEQLLKPWGGQPDFASVLKSCSGLWQQAPLSIAGWLFNTAVCSNKGSMTLHYTLPKGGTVGDFAARLPALYGENVRAVFNIPGAADDASFTLPVTITPVTVPEPLLPGEEQIQRMTSYAQRLNARLRFSAPRVLNQKINQTEMPLPWKTYSFTFITDIPPDRLFASTRFSGNGIRIQTITVALHRSRLTYILEGTLYADN
ncbi:type 4b pilus protein PilO2 [Rahnella sp. BCC 1045]|uniref:type 4b pilus protein PilO2 n=1 Tax=Rahnella sp. BCC 1045 TaxID=2816251 RepID=UPI001C25595C|nr:type 4b pilus protein PilO2 [Rahnella sp. BCC 1045]MBU9819682.1 type 4b pilus protein PilO2 [Rahnella sp. BCC 1045]